MCLAYSGSSVPLALRSLPLVWLPFSPHPWLSCVYGDLIPSSFFPQAPPFSLVTALLSRLWNHLVWLRSRHGSVSYLLLLLTSIPLTNRTLRFSLAIASYGPIHRFFPAACLSEFSSYARFLQWSRFFFVFKSHSLTFQSSDYTITPGPPPPPSSLLFLFKL